MNARQIEVFHAIMKAGTVTEAARQLGLTQPAVTASLKQLEARLGFNLFHRRGGRLFPTGEAEALNIEAGHIQDAVFVFSRLAERLKHDLSGHLRIVSPLAFSHAIIPDALVSFLDEQPDCTVDVATLHHGQILKSFTARGVQNDLGFTFGGDERPDVGFHALGDVDIVALIPSHWSLAENTSTTVRELAERPYICTFPGEPLGNAVDALTASAEVQMQNTVRVHTHILAAHLVSRGLGATLLDAITANYAASSFGKDTLRILPLETAPTLPVTAAYSFQHPPKADALAFIAAFRTALSNELPRRRLLR